MDPLVGNVADRLAAQVGFVPFEKAETGTALMILDALRGVSHAEDAMAFIAESITWNLWPKMISLRGRRPMTFQVSWNGVNIPIPAAMRTPPLPGYLRALEVLHESTEERTTEDGIEVVAIRAERPRATLGWLALTRFPFRNRRPAAAFTDDEEGGILETATPFEGNSRHVVLLRNPELVVTYDEHVALTDSNIEWAGVFLAASDSNDAFAAAEPPTHDAWKPDTVEDKSKRRVVNVALREIRKHVNRRFGGVITSPATGGSRSVARIANALGTIFSGIPGGGAGVASRAIPSTGTSPSRRRPTVAVERYGPVVEGDDRHCEVIFRLTPLAEAPRTRVCIAVDVATGDGNTVEAREDRPVGAPFPVLLSVVGPSPVDLVDDQVEVTFVTDIATETTWQIVSTDPDGVVVSFSIDAEALP